MRKIYGTIIMATFLLTACQEEIDKSDAYGNFETTTTTVSAEARGKLIYLDVEEGEFIPSGKLIAIVDTVQLHLQRNLLKSQIGTISQKVSDPNPDINVLNRQKANLVRERDRVAKLVSAKAATSKQLDDIEGQIVVVDQQISAAKNKASTINRGILAEKDPLRAQIKLIDQQIKDCYVYNPVSGTVINKLAESSEVMGFGSPLYTIADLKTLTLRAYSDAVSIQDLKINDTVSVIVDDENETMRNIQGKVSWISSEAEFTPKIIQTKKERVNLVYALKIEVPNDGRLKIGMPAEVSFDMNAIVEKNEAP